MSIILNKIKQTIGNTLANYLNGPQHGYVPYAVTDTEKLRKVLQPGDVVLVEGDRRVSVAIKYLTTSSWSHAAIYVGDKYENGEKAGLFKTAEATENLGGSKTLEKFTHGNNSTTTIKKPKVLLEADVELGVIVVPLEKYSGLNVRICRPLNLQQDDLNFLLDHLLSRLGHQYDLKNIFDLARYLFPLPPVPYFMRRRMLSIGSGDPTRAICSTLIAEAFGKIKYPILPIIENIDNDSMVKDDTARRINLKRELLHIRHHSLYVPRDFDCSPYFKVVKPTTAIGFNYKELQWSRSESPEEIESLLQEKD
jgi:hypothetical protein